MSNMKITATPIDEKPSFFGQLRHRLPKDTGIFIVMLVIALTFEIAGWYVRDQSFLLNTNRLILIVLQVAIIGIIAVGVTQVIITTGIDLSSGSVIALAAVVAASLAQTSDSLSPMFPSLVNMIVYTIAGALSGLAGVVLAARVSSGQSSMGMSYELDAIAAAVIGGSSLMGGVGRITGTLIGAMILGLIKSGFTFVGVDAYVQDIIKGIIIVAAVTIDMRRNRKKH